MGRPPPLGRPPSGLLIVLSLLRGGAGLAVSADTLARFDGYAMKEQLAIAHTAATAAAKADSVESAKSVLREMLDNDGDAEGEWLWHVDAYDVAVSLLSGGEPVLSYVHDLQRPSLGSGEALTLFGTAGGGAFVVRGEEEDAECESGGACDHANVLHLPPDDAFCPQLADLVTHLTEVGMGMPLELQRKRGASCCEGLREVVVSAADLHVAPPARFLPGQPCPPSAVLCAFQLLLEESGGSLSDVYGEELDLLSTTSSTTMRLGILATVEVMSNYFVRATSSAFPRSQLDGSIPVPPSIFDGAIWQAAADGFGGDLGGGFTVEYLSDAADDSEDDTDGTGTEAAAAQTSRSVDAAGAGKADDGSDNSSGAPRDEAPPTAADEEEAPPTAAALLTEDRVRCIFAWVARSFNGDSRYEDLGLGLEVVLGDLWAEEEEEAIAAAGVGAQMAEEMARGRVLLDEALACLPAEEDTPCGATVAMPFRVRNSLGAMGAGQWTGQYRTRPHALLDVRGLTSVGDWARTLPRNARRNLARATREGDDADFVVRVTPLRGDAPAPHSSLAHFRVVVAHELRVMASAAGSDADDLIRALSAAISRFYGTTEMAGEVREYRDKQSGVVIAFAHEVTKGKVIRGQWFYASDEAAKRFVWFHSVHDLVRRAIADEAVEVVDLGPSGSDAFSQLKRRFGFASVADWCRVADYTGPFRFADGDERPAEKFVGWLAGVLY